MLLKNVTEETIKVNYGPHSATIGPGEILFVDDPNVGALIYASNHTTRGLPVPRLKSVSDHCEAQHRMITRPPPPAPPVLPQAQPDYVRPRTEKQKKDLIKWKLERSSTEHLIRLAQMHDIGTKGKTRAQLLNMLTALEVDPERGRPNGQKST